MRLSLSWEGIIAIIHLFPKWNYTNPCVRQREFWLPWRRRLRLETEVRGTICIKEYQPPQILWEMEALGPWREPSSPHIFNLRPTDLVSAFTSPSWDDKFLLTSATMFVVTCCGTTCTKVGRQVKLKLEGIWSGWPRPQPLTEESSFSRLCHCGFWRKGEPSSESLWRSGQLSQDSPLTGSWVIARSPNSTVNLTFYLAYL